MQAMTVTRDEVARFDALAAGWWDPNGPMRALHRMNPARIRWILDRIREAIPAPAADEGVDFPERVWVAGRSAQQGTGGTPASAPSPPATLWSGARGSVSQRPIRVLDIGCGAGLAAEALARHGLDVLGLDAASETIEAARAHAAGRQLSLSYRAGFPEDLLAEGVRFPVITALEVIEHVVDPRDFVAVLADLLEPGGLLVMSTLNRSPQSFLAAKVSAEYLLRWLPVGTHDWRKFITPTELGRLLRGVGFRLTGSAGLGVDPLTGRWQTHRDLSINYMISALK